MESQTQVVETPRHVVETPHRVVSKSSDCSTDSEMSEPLVINTNRSVESQVIEQLATAKIEALQAPIWSTSNPRLVSDPALANITPVSDGDSEDEDEDDDFEVRAEWLGTSQYYRDYGLELQARGELEPLISYRDFLAKDLSRTPYNPSLYITLCAIDNDLGFTDISAANAYRALILIECGLNITLFLSFADLGEKVRAALATRLHTSSAIIIEDELEDLRKQAYRELLEGLLGCGAFWDGLKEAKKALQLAPTDPAILKSRHNLKLGFEDRHVGLKGLGATPSELRSLTRTGKIFQIKYPWLDEKLYMRTPALLRTVNRSLLDSSCEVRPVVFGTPLPNTLAQKPAPKAEGEDVGPLGIFATRDIKEGEVILVDKSITSVSDVPPSAHGYCDACHACLLPPYLHPRDVIRPSCCKLVAFCSKACYEIASSGYHSILCGKDIDWIYEPDSMLSSASSEAGNAGTAFRPVLFTRLLAVVLASNKQTSAKSSISTSIKDHPLQHPVIARMAANYAPPSKGIPDHTYGWQYYENVIAPTKMLLQLGIDIFKTRDWDPEVIQTIFWRMENNANAGNPSMFPSSETPASEIPETFKAPPLPPRVTGKFRQVNLNLNYLFFNHSCVPNVNWHGGVAYERVGLEWVRGVDDEMVRPGSSAVWCNSARDIQQGEQLFISYVGDPMGEDGDDQEDGVSEDEPGGKEGEDERKDGGRQEKCAWLKKWFEDGCGCVVCEEENRVEREKAERLVESGGGVKGGDKAKEVLKWV